MYVNLKEGPPLVWLCAIPKSRQEDAVNQDADQEEKKVEEAHASVPKEIELKQAA